MNLEQRVQMLEQEVQLLKAQIQATLLDMQEQLLNSKYPILHAEESLNNNPTTAEAPAAPPAAPTPVNSPLVKRVVLAETEEEVDPVDVRPMRAAPVREPDDDTIVAPPVVKVTSNGHRPAPVPEATKPAPKPSRADWEEEDYPQPRPQRSAEPPKPARTERIAQAAAPEAEDEESHDWIELENWVSQKVEKLGIVRTRELINLYTRQERFSRQEREMLLQFVNIYDGASKTSTKPRPAASADPVRPGIVPQTRAVVDEIRTELRQKRAAAKNRNETYRLSEQQELVMRLIAGILSAGDDEDFLSDSDA